MKQNLPAIYTTLRCNTYLTLYFVVFTVPHIGHLKYERVRAGWGVVSILADVSGWLQRGATPQLYSSTGVGRGHPALYVSPILNPNRLYPALCWDVTGVLGINNIGSADRIFVYF